MEFKKSLISVALVSALSLPFFAFAQDVMVSGPTTVETTPATVQTNGATQTTTQTTVTQTDAATPATTTTTPATTLTTTPATTTMATATTMAIPASDMSALADIAVIDKAEILAGVLASNKRMSGNVYDFGKTMIDHHGNNFTQLLQLVNNSPMFNPNSGQAAKLMDQTKSEMMRLGSLQGAAFDQAYADAMVKGHQDALNLIDTQLLKNVKSEQVRQFLTTTRAGVAEHLDKAKMLQASVKP